MKKVSFPYNHLEVLGNPKLKPFIPMTTIRKPLIADAKELQAVGQYLLDNGYLKKVYGVEKVYGNHAHTIGEYYVAYYNHKDLLKWFDCSYNGLPIYVRPFHE